MHVSHLGNDYQGPALIRKFILERMLASCAQYEICRDCRAAGSLLLRLSCTFAQVS